MKKTEDSHITKTSDKISAPFPLGGSFLFTSAKQSNNEVRREMNWLERISMYLFAVGLTLIVVGFNTLNIDDKSGHLIILAGLGVTVAGLVIWSSINILLKGFRNVES